jgi:hypothetical protein
MMFGLMLLLACSESPCIKSTGEDAIQWRSVSPFQRMALFDGFDYIISSDSGTEIRLEGGKNLLSFVSVQVKDGQLEIKDGNKCRFLRDNKRRIKVYLPAGKIDYLYYAGYFNLSGADTLKNEKLNIEILETGDVKLNLNCKNVFVLHRGFGDIRLSGRCNSFNIIYENFCEASAAELKVDTLAVNANSFADGYFFCHQKADILLKGKGNIYLAGSPLNINLQQQGEGRLIKQ